MQYTSIFNFSDIDLSKYADGLVPVIVQDVESKSVLMLGFMNEEAFSNTCKTGYLTFYSRSRKCIWQKGETSGNVLNVVSMHLDCDNDTILALVHPVGPTCHKGTKTCWGARFENFGFIGTLYNIVHNKMINGHDEKSYTSNLLTCNMDKLCNKVKEECEETIVEAKKLRVNAFLYEACDLIYHLIVLLNRMGISQEDIDNELSKRHKK
ncbi:MAG: Histidine biosynthesis bifunctional protein HisIE [Wendovervirus sonii]|uniref:Histidine biosynthesis bifunctional protein HisIE n=1 Tax=phage Lak_Megaphage_Sonny TaxID=3109229 RepID=A0ABZ0Z4C1_9CAUD|nr:MAG: Histidine biosynthesis bifunctional protein HisIE [phage Lak_Megaphage_Sonny]